jgi:hypothetical protein
MGKIKWLIFNPPSVPKQPKMKRSSSLFAQVLWKKNQTCRSSTFPHLTTCWFHMLFMCTLCHEDSRDAHRPSSISAPDISHKNVLRAYFGTHPKQKGSPSRVVLVDANVSFRAGALVFLKKGKRNGPHCGLLGPGPDHRWNSPCAKG